MNRAVSPRFVASWLFCASWIVCALLVGLSPSAFGQHALPSLIPVNVPNFAIPFEIGGSAHAIREVELLVSQDRGRSWNIVARQPVETGKFAFRADSDGEYWFAFRTITSAGTPNSMTGHPELRVLVDTGNPAAVPPPQPDDTRPIMPPRPERFRPENLTRSQSQPTQQPNAEVTRPATGNEPQVSENARIAGINVERPGQILAPRFPGFDPTEQNREGDLIGDLLSGMSPFMDVQPVVMRNIPGNQVTADRSNTAPNVPNVLGTPSPPADRPAGSISGIVLNNTDTRPQIIVRWNTGHEQSWGNAQIDVLRGSTREGQWSPIAINLPNNGEYWWYLSPEDLNPFYVAVRIRSVHSGNSVDVTQSRIEIDPRMALFQSQRP